MLFAEVSDAVWLAVIGLITVFVNAVTVIATMIIKELLDQKRAGTIKTDTIIAANKVKEKLEEVTKDQNEKMQKVAMAQNEKLDSVVVQVEEVHKATNSMKDELVKKTEAEGIARGGIEERARAEERAKLDEKIKTDVPKPSPPHIDVKEISGPVDISIKGEAEISPGKEKGKK